MIYYKLYKANSKNASINGKYYARVALTGVTNLSALADRIQRNCTAKRSDVLAVLTELVEVMQDELQSGRRVKLDSFGSFKIGLRSTGAESAKKFTVTDNVKSLHVVFQPETHYDRANKTRTKTFLTGAKLAEWTSERPEEQPNP